MGCELAALYATHPDESCDNGGSVSGRVIQDLVTVMSDEEDAVASPRGVAFGRAA